MGVKGLWELLSPVGRRINIETLEGKILAIDASIWITQFIKAMKDEDGKIVKNAHLLGTLRRILKLLHNRIRTVFVFDGATPTLKIQTVRARRLIREKQEIDVKKSAERLLLAKIKRHLMTQSTNLKNPSRIAPEFHPLETHDDQQSSNHGSSLIPNQAVEISEDDSDEWEDGYSHLHDKDISSNTRATTRSRSGDSDEEEEDWMIPENTDEIDSGTLASLPPTIRKHVIEEARKKESRRNRAHYLPVAEDPLLYSKTQLANFLRTSKFNQVVMKTQEESDRLEREKFGSGHIISSDGSRRYILRKEDQRVHQSPEDDLCWLNESSGEEVDFPDKNPKRRRIISDESDSDLDGGFIRSGENNPSPDLSSGGFLKQDVDDTSNSTAAEQWMCANCTLYNDITYKICSMCGSPSIPSVLSRDMETSCLKQEETISSISVIHQTQPENEGEVANATSLKEYQSSSDEWEDNYSDNHGENTRTDSAAKDQPPPQRTLNEEIITRAVLSASSMGDWAGRVVRKALQGSHSFQPTVSSKGIDGVDNQVTKGDFESTDHDLESIKELTPAAPGGFMQEGTNFPVKEDQDNGFEVNELEFERKAYRDADLLNDGMVNDIKALLDAFDIPYISAPFEAEAQCAFLEMAGLVDGIVTEDSDVFLFGGRSVYKNIFEDKKFVEVYLAEDLKKDLGIDRSDLVTLAYLLGSDYTDGVKGIGIVNAMEIIDVFGSKKEHSLVSTSSVLQGGFFTSANVVSDEKLIQNESRDPLLESIRQLESFKEWLMTPYDFSSLNVFKSKQKKSNNDEEKELQDPSEIIQKRKLDEFSKKHVGMRKKWIVKDSFPDPKIAEAYLSPHVNTSKEKFHFESPKLFKIKNYVSRTLGWTEEEIARKITPVIQRYIEERGTTQSRIDSYFLTYHDNKRFAAIQSERLKGAVTRVKERQNE